MRTEVEGKTTLTAWRGLARLAALVSVIVIGAVAAVLRDVDAAMITVGFIAAVGLLRFRRGAIGLLVMVVLFADVAFFSLTGAAVNLSQSPGFIGSALTSVLSVIAITGLAGAIGGLIELRSAHAEAAVRTVRIAAAVLVVVAVVASLVATSGRNVSASAGDIKLTAEHVKFSSKRIETHSGKVGIIVTNKDFFWHTFTVSKLGVNLKVPTRGERRFEFTARPGTYEFKCLVPGHAQAGMKGTLIVR